jgi:hypothetical protein
VTAEAAYLAFLRERDGEADLVRRTLPRREARHARFAAEPVRSTRPVDAATFARNLARVRPEPGLDPRMLWLLATAKANQAERFAVGLAELYGRMDPDVEPVRLHVQLQEFYHTRILADVCAIFGLPVRWRPPALVPRLMIHFMVHTPETWHLPFAGCAEMVGCVIFRALRERGVALFADEPRVATRIALLYDEILTDELGHVFHVASQLGPARLAFMHRLYRALGHRLAAQMPELDLLFGRTELRRRCAAFRTDTIGAELCDRGHADR